MHVAVGRQDCLACDYCKSVYFSEKNEDGVRILDEVPGLLCPVCAIPLMNASLTGLPLRYCKQCRGMLIQMGEFTALIDALRTEEGGVRIPPAADPSELRTKIDCPQCRQRMDTHFYAGGGNVVIEDCSSCLLNWLDHGKLMRIVHAPHGSDAEALDVI